MSLRRLQGEDRLAFYDFFLPDQTHLTSMFYRQYTLETFIISLPRVRLHDSHTFITVACHSVILNDLHARFENQNNF